MPTTIPASTTSNQPADNQHYTSQPATTSIPTSTSDLSVLLDYVLYIVYDSK